MQTCKIIIYCNGDTQWQLASFILTTGTMSVCSEDIYKDVNKVQKRSFTMLAYTIFYLQISDIKGECVQFNIVSLS